MIENLKFKIENWNKKGVVVSLLVLIIFIILSTPYTKIYSQSAGELKDRIEDHNSTIRKLEEEIKNYERQIETTNSQARTLQSTIAGLELNQKKVNVEIRKTETSIAKSNLRIQELSGQMLTTQEKIDINSQAIASTINSLVQSEDQTLIEHILSGRSLSEVLDNYESTTQFQEQIRDKSKELTIHKDDLADKKEATEAEKRKLLSLQADLKNQHRTLEINKKEQASLLAITKNQEAEYKKLLASKQAEKAYFEAEIFKLASQLQYILDPNKVPSPGKGVLGWPLKDVFVTQQFGKTSDSGRLYTSGTHDGVDFRAPIGTPVFASMSGVVAEVNLGAVQNCQYGKWVLVKHSNGLSTLYAHLSDVRVSKGQDVTRGEVLGFSGNTGYATGPHLHFTLYVSEAVTFKQYTCKSGYKVSIPIAHPSAYLDPMQYF